MIGKYVAMVATWMAMISLAILIVFVRDATCVIHALAFTLDGGMTDGFAE